MAELKTKKTRASVTAFINAIDHPQRRADAKELLKLFKDVTGMRPAMWGPTIIGYGVYRDKPAGSGQGNEWPRVGFSPRKANLTIYILPDCAKYTPLLKKLGKYKMSKACLYINKLSDVDAPTLGKIIKETLLEMNRRYPIK